MEHKLGFIHANAGIDRSNIDQEQDIVLLLPENPDASAKVISQSLSQYGLCSCRSIKHAGPGGSFNGP